MNLPNFDAADYAAIGSYLAILVGGGLAWGQLRHVRKVHREQTRPYVIVDFEFRSSTLITLAIKNIGQTMARDVRISFDKPLQAAIERSPARDSSIFTEPLAMMAPGRKITVLLDSFPQREKREDLPARYSVQIQYEDSDGKRYKDPPYPLDLAMYRSSLVDPKGLSDLVSEVKNIQKTLAKWTDHLDGVRVYTVDNERYESDIYRSFIRRELGQIKKEQGILAAIRWLVNKQLKLTGWKR